MKRVFSLLCVIGMFACSALSVNALPTVNYSTNDLAVVSHQSSSNLLALGKRDKAHGNRLYSAPANQVALGKRDKAHGNRLYSAPANQVALGKRDKAHG